ncbi:MAG: TetR/AcrR family transcriptional regulator [Ktedonobacteraceae bacterium]|nr:TetR/AcrR family transcriptional regulator [Ktedonobacteraceae bacterium]
MARKPKVVEDRREQILDAATRVFAHKGFIRATNKDIADEAGITPGLIYHYFESKEDVLKAVIETRSPLRVLHTLSPETLALPPDQFLRLMFLQVLRVVENEPFVQLIRILLPESLHNPQIAPTALNTLKQALDFLEHYLQSSMDRGVLRQVDASLIAQTIFGCVMGFVLRRQLLHDPLALRYSHEQIADAVIDTVLSGLLPR